MARPEKSPGNGPIAAPSTSAFWTSSATLFRALSSPGIDASLLGLGAEISPQGKQMPLSEVDHHVAHRLSRLDGLVRRRDVGESEGLRHVVHEFAAFEHARDLGGRLRAQL